MTAARAMVIEPRAPRSCRRREPRCRRHRTRPEVNYPARTRSHWYCPGGRAVVAHDVLAGGGIHDQHVSLLLPTATRPVREPGDNAGHSHREAAAPDDPARHQINQRPAVRKGTASSWIWRPPIITKAETVGWARRQPRDRTTDLNQPRAGGRSPIQQHSLTGLVTNDRLAAVESAVVEVRDRTPDTVLLATMRPVRASRTRTSPSLLPTANMSPLGCSYHNSASARPGSPSGHAFPCRDDKVPPDGFTTRR